MGHAVGGLLLMAALLFATTLWQAREIGKLSAVVGVQDATIKYMGMVQDIKNAHQLLRDEARDENDDINQGLKNELIQMAVSFEEKGLADPIALDARESRWLAAWVRRNSRNGEQGSHLSPTDTREAPPHQD